MKKIIDRINKIIKIGDKRVEKVRKIKDIIIREKVKREKKIEIDIKKLKMEIKMVRVRNGVLRIKKGMEDRLMRRKV